MGSKKKNNEDDIPVVGKSWYLGWQDDYDIFEETEVPKKVGNRTYLVVVIYDIVENKSRYRVSKVLQGYGYRVQRSAFECHMTLRKYEEMISKILPHIDQEKDLLRVYRLSGKTEVKMWGKIPETFDEDFIIL